MMASDHDVKYTADDLKRLVSRIVENAELSDLGAWLAAQLRVVEYWAQRGQSTNLPPDTERESKPVHQTVPQRWEMTRGIALWPWQRECAAVWLGGNHRGIAKVATGAGKTVFALHVIERLQRERDPDVRVVVVVPTIVLMNQWTDALHRLTNLPPSSIGRLGGGNRDDLRGDRRLLICVINSAAKWLANIVKESGHGNHLLLVVDECHRARGDTMSQVFNCARTYNLGLSATPEDEGETAGPLPADASGGPDDVVLSNLGSVIYELTVKQAIKQGILATFDLRHYGLPLEEDERLAYEKHSREIRDLARRLRAAARSKFSSVFRFARHIAARSDGPLREDAQQYVLETRRRKRLLYRARSRERAVLALVRQCTEESPDARILLFHESIDEVMTLYLTLLRHGFRVAVDHSELPDSIRAASIDQFRSGLAQILVSARALIEGFDVPAADVGIIAASTASARQRIQTVGRILRRPKDPDEAKRAIIHSLYISHTVDESIFDKVRFDHVTGADRNTFFLWEPPPIESSAEERRLPQYQPTAQSGPPRTPKPSEEEIPWDNLRPGDRFPGRYAGEEFHFDEQGNVRSAAGRDVTNPADIADQVRSVCPRVTKFRVTPLKRAVLCWDRDRKILKFAGFLKAEFQYRPCPSEGGGAEYQIAQVRGRRRILDKNGRYALLPGQATDAARGQDAERAIQAAERLEKETNHHIRTIYVRSNTVFCRIEGDEREMCTLAKGFEFRER